MKRINVSSSEEEGGGRAKNLLDLGEAFLHDTVPSQFSRGEVLGRERD